MNQLSASPRSVNYAHGERAANLILAGSFYGFADTSGYEVILLIQRPGRLKCKGYDAISLERCMIRQENRGLHM